MKKHRGEERQSAMLSLACGVRDNGSPHSRILIELALGNRDLCEPPLPARELERIAGTVAGPSAGVRGAELPVPKWPDPPEAAAYHGLAGEFVHLIEGETEADPVGLLAQLLVGFGSVVGRAPYFSVGADRHHTNEFLVLVGESSRARKGTSWGIARRLLKSIDPDWADQRQQGGLSSGEGLLWAVRDPIAGRSAIRKEGRIVGYQDVEEDRGVADKRLLVLEPEFASTLRVMGRDGSTLSALVRQAWDSGDLRVLTKNSPAQATGAHISNIGHVTREELLRYLDRTETANGFINRFLLVCVRRARILPEGGRVQELDFGPLVEQLRRAVDWGRERGELRRSDDARALWYEVYEQLSEGHPGLFGAVISRAEAHVVRLSLLYALLDGAIQIERPHLEAALALWRYSEASARFIFAESLGDPVADDLLNALAAKSEGLTRTEISKHFAGHLPAAELRRVLAGLEERGLVRVERQTTSGREAERWFASTKSANSARTPDSPEVLSQNSLPSPLDTDSDSETTSVPSHTSLNSPTPMELGEVSLTGNGCPVRDDLTSDCNSMDAKEAKQAEEGPNHLSQEFPPEAKEAEYANEAPAGEQRVADVR